MRKLSNKGEVDIGMAIVIGIVILAIVIGGVFGMLKREVPPIVQPKSDLGRNYPTVPGGMTPTQMPSPIMNRLQNAQIGYSLFYPADWQVSSYISATEFAKDAQCDSVEVIDFQPPPGSGAASMLHSFVQICAKSLMDSLTLDAFMRQTYGNTFTSQFQVTNLSGMQVYQTINANKDTTLFLQTNRYRIQIVTAVVAVPDKRDVRLSQVQQVLASLSFQ